MTIPGTHENDAETGDLDLKSFYGIDIIGEEASRTIIDGNGLDRVFDVRPSAPADFWFLTITGGSVPTLPGSAAEARGGGIRVQDSSARVMHCRVTDSRAEVGGGISSKEGATCG